MEAEAGSQGVVQEGASGVREGGNCVERSGWQLGGQAGSLGQACSSSLWRGSEGSARFLEHAAVAVVRAHAPARPGPTWRTTWRAAPKSETSPFPVETKRLQPYVQCNGGVLKKIRDHGESGCRYLTPQESCAFLALLPRHQQVVSAHALHTQARLAMPGLLRTLLSLALLHRASSAMSGPPRRRQRMPSLADKLASSDLECRLCLEGQGEGPTFHLGLGTVLVHDSRTRCPRLACRPARSRTSTLAPTLRSSGCRWPCTKPIGSSWPR